MRMQLLVPMAVLLVAGSARTEEPLKDRVDRAIDRGVAWLKTMADAEGSFGLIGGASDYQGNAIVYRCPPTVTALATYTLLKCGVPTRDKVVRKSLTWLEKKHKRPEYTYEIAILMLVLEAKATPYKRDQKRELDLAAQRAGLSVPEDVVRASVERVLDLQEEEGPEHPRHGAEGVKDRARGWAYTPGGPRPTEYPRAPR